MEFGKTGDEFKIAQRLADNGQEKDLNELFSMFSFSRNQQLRLISEAISNRALDAFLEGRRMGLDSVILLDPSKSTIKKQLNIARGIKVGWANLILDNELAIFR